LPTKPLQLSKINISQNFGTFDHSAQILSEKPEFFEKTVEKCYGRQTDSYLLS
jgi:hypothetical protein